MNGYRKALAAVLMAASGAGLGVVGFVAFTRSSRFDLEDVVVSAVLLGVFSFAARMSFGESPLTDVWDVLRSI
ncbi:MAG: hypothetical protein ACRDJ9_32740, partial [Dehalococcoidia bacterium]